MIEPVEIQGRHGMMGFFDKNFVSVDTIDESAVIKVLWDDGGILFLIGPKAEQDVAQEVMK